MLPASDDIPGNNDTGAFAGGSEKQRPPPSTPTFDQELMTQLTIFHEELCKPVKRWATQQTALEVLDTLLELGGPLIDMLYTRYHDRNARSAEQADRLENWFNIVCLVVFGLRDMRAMRNVGGKMSPEEELPLYKRLRELDGMLEGILPKQQGPGPSGTVRLIPLARSLRPAPSWSAYISLS
jgi:hypothetical protein